MRSRAAVGAFLAVPVGHPTKLLGWTESAARRQLPGRQEIRHLMSPVAATPAIARIAWIGTPALFVLGAPVPRAAAGAFPLGRMHEIAAGVGGRREGGPREHTRGEARTSAHGMIPRHGRPPRTLTVPPVVSALGGLRLELLSGCDPAVEREVFAGTVVPRPVLPHRPTDDRRPEFAIGMGVERP